ncbi:hypothetical protein PBPRC0023 (plasmid) [Photobacterium profundum SS9]|uniref:Uncharacterized protein n=2 Tax=Photobacterium profundum TaxID=74109 RepID=Q6LWB6_PHOPR|nr:hypothetical protein PBPRC0023 [Photobacterium profundum SS9]
MTEKVVMTKSKRVQVYIEDSELLKTLDLYMKQNPDKSQSEACGDLMAIGARVWKHSQEDDGEQLTVMDMLEKLLRSSYSTQAFLHLSGNKNIKKVDDDNSEAFELKSIIEKANAISKDKVDELLGKEE